MNEQEFQQWYKDVRKLKPFLPENPDDEKDYDYRMFYNKMPDDALKLKSGDPNAHFNDIGKRPSHPTFSEESAYSTNETKGGKWIDAGDGKWEFQHSDYTINNSNKTNEYIKNNEKPGTVKVTYKGGIVLPEITVTPKRNFFEGFPKPSPIQRFKDNVQ